MADSPINSSPVPKSMLLVAGMHRSGTSAMTRVLNLSGASLPETLLVPVKGENEKGFWESQKVMELHDEILQSLGGDWSGLHTVPQQWFASDEADLYKAKLIELIRSEFGCSHVGIVKDPRICKLVPLWEAALHDLGIVSHYVICVRNPLEVAQSLEVRNGYTRNYSVNLWFTYLSSIENYTRGLKRVFVNYDDLLNQPFEVVNRVGYFFGLELDVQSDDVREAVDLFLSKALKHHSFDMSDLQNAPDVPSVAKYFYAWLEQQAVLDLNGSNSYHTLNIEDELEKRATSDFSLLQKNLRQTEEQLNQKYSLIQQLSQKQALHSEREAEWVRGTRSLNAMLIDSRSQFQALQSKYQELMSQHVELENQHLELEKELLILEGERREIEQKSQLLIAQHRVLEDGLDSRAAEIKLLKEKHNQELVAWGRKSETLDEQHLLELQGYANEVKTLSEELHKYREIADLNAGLSEKLRMSERRCRDQSQIIAWKLGVRLTGVVRRFRSSLVGRALLLIKAALTLNIRRYLSFQKRLRTVRKSSLFDEDYYLKTYPLIRYSTKSPIEHYVGVGEREGRQPNSIFMPYFYSQKLPDGDNKWGSSLVHYIKEGAGNGYDPSPDFSTKFYAQTHGVSLSESLAHHLAELKESGNAYLAKKQGLAKQDGGVELCESKAAEVSKSVFVGPIENEIAALMSELGRLTLDDKVSSLNFKVVEKPLVSIIVPFFNKVEYTIDCLFALNKQAFKNYEVILIDDASSRDDCSILSSINGVTVIRNEVNLGYLLSCNLAASESKGDYIVQLNNDTLVLEGWLESLINTFEQHPEAGLVGSLLLAVNGQISEAGGIIFNDASGYNYGRGKSPYEKRFNYCREVDYCSGASIIIKRRIWESLGGYDETYAPAYYEDTDLAMRVRALGYKVIYNPFSRVVHHEGISSGTSLESGVKKYQEINKAKFYKKWKKALDRKPPIPTGELVDGYVRQQRRAGWILWVDSVTPTPDKDSGSIDTINFFEQATADDWGVTFMPWDGLRHEGRYTKDLQTIGVECIYDPSSSAEQHLNTLTDSYDVVVLSRVTVAKYAYPIIRRLYPTAKIIFNTVDLHFLRYARESALLAKDSQHQLSTRSQRVERDEELEMVSNCDVTIVVSEEEKKILQGYVEPADVRVIPLFRDVVGCSNAYENRLNIGFIGGYQHPPNVDAVKYFISKIWPLVSSKIKNCKFVIAGSNAPAEILNLAGARVEVRGFIPTVTELLEEVRLMVAPLRYGAGIKGKVVSGLCHGVPQVVSKEAAEGMGLEKTAAVMIAGDAQQFADSIIELYNNRLLWNNMSRAAVCMARQSYSKEAIGGKITSLLNEL